MTGNEPTRETFKTFFFYAKEMWYPPTAPRSVPLVGRKTELGGIRRHSGFLEKKRTMIINTLGFHKKVK